MADTPQQTLDDRSQTRLLAVLLYAAKLLQAAQRMQANLAPDRVTPESIAFGAATKFFFRNMISLYGCDGDSLERDALALGKHLGWKVEQLYTSPNAGGVN